MSVIWTKHAITARQHLFRNLDALNPQAASKQDAAIVALAKTLDGLASYRRLPSGARFVTVPRYPIVLIYERDLAGDATVLDVAPTRSNWKPSPSAAPPSA